VTEIYNFNNPIKQRRWVVDGFIPANSLVPFIAKESAGKSFFVEALAVALIHGSRFLGRKTQASNVLLIDQDTPEETLHIRLNAFKNAITTPQVRKLYQVTEQVSLDDGSLIRKINENKQAKVIIIDSLHSVCGELNPNTTSDMYVLSELKRKVLNNGRTIIFTHHISTHNLLKVDEMMTTETIGNLSMGSSAILQQADTYFVLGSKTNSDLEKLYVRPVQKRVPLKIKPFVVKLEDDKVKKKMKFVFDSDYAEKIPFFEPDKDVLCVLKERWKKKLPPIGVPIIFNSELNRRHEMYHVRRAISRLLKSKKIIEHRVGLRKFMYEYNPKELR
jgi:RecA-family ATPase